MRRLIVEILTQPRVSIMGVLFVWVVCNALWTGFLAEVSRAAQLGYPWAQAFMRHAEMVSYVLVVVVCLSYVLLLPKKEKVNEGTEENDE